MTINSLSPGQRFALAAMPERTGQLVRLGTGSALVRYHGAKVQSFTSARTGQAVKFVAPEAPVTISLATEVVAMEVV